MKISAINLFNTNKLQQNSQQYKPNFCSAPMEEDSFVLESSKQAKNTPLKKGDANFILKEGERLIEQYNSAQTEDEKEKAISSYQKNIKATLDNGGEKYSTIRHYFGNHFNMSTNYKVLNLLNASEDEKQKLVETIISDTANIINFDQSLSDNDIGIKDVLTKIIENEDKILKQRNIDIQLNNTDKLNEYNQHPWVYENFVIISNLVQNAIKYSPDNSTIKIDIQEREVVEKRMIPKFDRTRNVLFFIIEDDGIGIPKENQETIFDKGTRGNNVGSIQGTGQGMNDIKNSVLAGKHKFIRIISPLKEDEPIYKGTRIECPLNVQ